MFLRPQTWLLAAASVSIIVVRLLGAANDLWLDEIWTLELVKPLRSPLEVFTKIEVEHHTLYTLWAYLLGPDASSLPFRLPALLSGLLTVGLAGWIVAHQSPARTGAGFAIVLVGFSYLGVHFGSEARGYAPATALALLAFAALLRGIDRRELRWRVFFAVALCLAFLAQPLAINLLPASGVWILVRRAPSLARAFNEALAWLIVPTTFCVGYYLLVLSHLETGGGPENALLDVAGNAAAYTFGLPSGGALIAAIAGIGVLGCVFALWREGNDLWSFYLVGVLVAPVAMLWLRGSTLVYERYFVLSSVLALLMTSQLLTHLWHRGQRALSIALVVVFLVGNGIHAVPLLRFGRGEYQEIVRRIAAETPTPEIRYSADHPFRFAKVIRYHAPRAAPGRTFRYVKYDAEPEWVLRHSVTKPRSGFSPFVKLPRGDRFRRVFTVGSAPMSGWDIAVYRRER